VVHRLINLSVSGFIRDINAAVLVCLDINRVIGHKLCCFRVIPDINSAVCGVIRDINSAVSGVFLDINSVVSRVPLDIFELLIVRCYTYGGGGLCVCVRGHVYTYG
jgi:hypothetical protein